MTARRRIAFVLCLTCLLVMGAAGPLAVPPSSPPDRIVLSDIAYGDHARQRLDVYRSAMARDAPVIIMVHGGGWRSGDKAEAGPLQQAEDIAAALDLSRRKHQAGTEILTK